VNYTVYFHAVFSQPLRKFGVWSVDMHDFNLYGGSGLVADQFQSDDYYERVKHAHVLQGCKEMEGDHLGFFTEFSTTSGEQVLVKSGISFVDMDGARKNLEHDIPQWSFNTIY
jgi:putative alpha-1,2-mannosidase